MDKIEKAERDLERAFRKSWWEKIVTFVEVRLEILDRMLFWAWNMRYSYDFDAHTMYAMLYYKLDRLYKCFRDHGNCVWDSDINNSAMRKLRIARELAKRLMEDSYNTQADSVMTFYGRLQMKFTPIPERRVSSCEFYLDRAKPEEQKKALELLHKAQKLDDQQRKNEKDYLFKLLHKYTDIWWD